MPKINAKQVLTDAALILFGSFFLAVGYSLFLTPAHISPGGVYGLAMVLRELAKTLFGLDLGVGTIALFFNIPLFLLAMHLPPRRPILRPHRAVGCGQAARRGAHPLQLLRRRHPRDQRLDDLPGTEYLRGHGYAGARTLTHVQYEGGDAHHDH